MLQYLLDTANLDPLLEQVSALRWVQNVVLVAGFVVTALIVDFLISRVFTYWVGRTKTDLDDRFVALLHRPIVGTIISVGIWAVVLRADLADPIRIPIKRVLLTILLWFWASFALRAGLLLIEAVSRLQTRKPFIEPRMLPLAATLHRIGVVAAAIYLLLAIWGINVGPLLAGAGILGIALGFAAKDTLSNLFSGIFIMADAPYEIGDFIVLGTGERGEVTKIGLRSTRLLTRDDIEVTIPNSVIANAKILNESGGPEVWERVRADVQVAYGTDIDRLRQVLIEVAVGDSHIASSPEPRVRMRGFGESGLNFQLLGWINNPELKGRALDSLYDAIYKRFAEDGIEIPYPVRRVVMPQPSADSQQEPTR